MKKTVIVYELLPAKPERGLFCEIIRILCKEFRAPNFDPHLTLFVSPKNDESPKKVLRQVRARPIRLNIRGVAFSAKFTKTLFVRFKSNPALKRLAVDLGRAAKFPTNGPKDPHVSLLYKKIPRGVKKELAKVIKLPFRSAIFDSIAAVRLTLPVRSGTNVTKWKILAKKSLRR
jgi:2'-5' RNA ligase